MDWNDECGTGNEGYSSVEASNGVTIVKVLISGFAVALYIVHYFVSLIRWKIKKFDIQREERNFHNFSKIIGLD